MISTPPPSSLLRSSRMLSRIEAFDWSTTLMGPRSDWASRIKDFVKLILCSRQPMFLAWGEDLILLYNDAYSSILAERHPSALGQPLLEVWAEAKEQLERLTDRVLDGDSVALNDYAVPIKQDGLLREANFSFSYTPILDDQEHVVGIFCACTETTSQLNEYRRRNDEREELRRLVQQMPGFVGVLSGPVHVYQYVNDAYVTISGARDFIGRTVREVFPELEGQGFYELLDQVYSTGTRYIARAMPIKLEREQGDRFIDFLYEPVRDDNGDVTGIFVGGYDVTDAHNSAELLRASANEFQTLAEAMPNQVWAATPDGKLNWFNGRVFQYSGRAFNDLAGDGWASMVHPDDLPGAVPQWQRALESGSNYEVEFRLLRHDGDYRWHIARAVSIRSETGDIVRWIGTNTDIQEQKSSAQALAELNATLEAQVQIRTSALIASEEALRQAQKMEAVGQLTGGIAHDFNNLLGGISAGLELLDLRLKQGQYDKVGHYIEAAQSSAKRAAALTHRLLAFSRRQTLNPTPTNVNRLVGDMEEMLRRTIGPSIHMEVVGAIGLWPTLIDPHQLENALLNLCINARDAMPDGGRITVETANKWLDHRAASERNVPPGQYISVCVTDTGTGMSPDVIARAFDPFFTTKPIGSGTGLGLSMIYGFVRQSGGQVRIYSEVGMGSTVCLYLPRYYGEAIVPKSEEPAEAPVSAVTSATIMVVDDEVTLRVLLKEVLEETGYRVLESADGATALHGLQANGPVDLLVTDVGLPGLNGRQLADAARSIMPKLKVLFITGYAENAVIGNGHLEPGMEILTKPFTIDVFAARVRELTSKK